MRNPSQFAVRLFELLGALSQLIDQQLFALFGLVVVNGRSMISTCLKFLQRGFRGYCWHHRIATGDCHKV